MPMNICTIIAKNYSAHARVLVSTFLDQHPEADITVLVVDQNVGDFDIPGAKVRSIYDIGLSVSEVNTMAAIYDVQELATATKPWLLQCLLDEGRDHIMYFDPDIWVMGDLSDLADAARAHSIVLTPHVTKPMARDGLRPTETDVNRSGIYNLGFVALGDTEDARDFLRFWQERLRTDCITDLENGYFVDQRWVDWAPGMWDHHIVRDTGLNAAYWNLAERPISRSVTGEYLAGTSILRFLHLSGYSPDTPHLLSKHQGSNARILLSAMPDLRDLTDQYAEMLKRARVVEARKLQAPFLQSSGGVRLDCVLRSALRDLVVDGIEFPDAFASGNLFEDWLAEAIPTLGPHGLTVPRGVSLLWSKRPDLSSGSDLSTPEGHARARGWLDASGRTELGWPTPVVDGMLLAFGQQRPDTPHWADPHSLSVGVNVAGYLSAELGVGEAARSLVEALESAKISVSTYDFRGSASRCNAEWSDRGPRNAPYDTTIVCINADMVEGFAQHVGRDYFVGRKTIGLWFWEATEFPEQMHSAFEWFDEIWVTSEYTAEVLRPHAGNRTVAVIPLPASNVPDSQITRDELNLPSGFNFLFVFDWLSVPERKNPAGLIDAFQRAFPDPSDSVNLVIKTINGSKKIAELEQLRYIVKDRPDIHIVDGYVSAAERDAYMLLSDCYISLHRCEGYGLTMAEAMASGIPVIATAYSGNLSFMTDESGILIPFQLEKVPDGHEPYPAGSSWALPDYDAAAEAMLKLALDPTFARELGDRGKEWILSSRSRETVGKAIQLLLAKETAIGERPMVSPHMHVQAPDGSIPAREKVSRHVNHGPRRSWDEGRGFRRFIRRGLRRVLSPYLVRQHEFEVNVSDALVQTEQKLDQIHGSLLDSIGALHSTIAHQPAYVLKEELGPIDGRLQHLESHLFAKPFMVKEFERTSVAGLRSRGYAIQNGTADLASPYLSFENRFRGSEELIKHRQSVYISMVNSSGLIVDLGCGRGEFLDVLAEAGLHGIGVDLDEGMISQARSRGHEVVAQDILEYISSLDDGCCSCIFSAQVVEHLPTDTFLQLLRECRRVLMPSGRLIMETVNPHSIRALRMFWIDLTHHLPIYPEVALAHCQSAGFAEAHAFFPNNGGEDWDQAMRDAGEYAIIASPLAGLDEGWIPGSHIAVSSMQRRFSNSSS